MRRKEVTNNVDCIFVHAKAPNVLADLLSQRLDLLPGAVLKQTQNDAALKDVPCYVANTTLPAHRLIKDELHIMRPHCLKVLLQDVVLPRPGL